MKKEALQDRMEKLRTFVTDADAALRDGKVVNLGTLEREIADICAKAVALPPADAREIQPYMADLIGELERLSFALKDFRDNLKT